MKYRFSSICLFFCLAFAAGCGSRQTAFEPRQFPLLKVPAAVSSSDGAFENAAYYFWDNFTDTSEIFHSDSSFVNGVPKQEVERNFAVWISTIDAIRTSDALKSVRRMYERISVLESADTSSNVLEELGGLMGKYLYDPNSPVRNEDLYGEFASLMASCALLPPHKRDIYEYEAGMCSLNRTGTAAADFTFSDSQGRKYSLYDIESEYTLLFFSNPGCAACKQIISELQGNEKLRSLVVSGRLAVVNIYIDDNLEEWYCYLHEYPDNWYNGYDPNYVIRTDVLYNVRAIPSLYLLDRYKTVILKDAPEDKVFSVLGNLE